MEVLGLCSYPLEAACTRYRLMQFVGPLAEKEINLTVLPLLTKDEFAALYRRGQTLQKAIRLLNSARRQLFASVNARKFDVLLVQREAMIIGPPIFEWLYKQIGKVYNLQKYAAEALAKNVYNFTPETISILYGYHPLVKSYYFNGKEAGIDNVYDAARFCEKVLKDNSVSVFLKQNYRFASNAVARKGITGIAGKIRSRMFKKSALAG